VRASNKRGMSIMQIETLIGELEAEWGARTEITSKEIGEQVLEKLKNLDEITYIRYASVYHKFESAEDFLHFISEQYKK